MDFKEAIVCLSGALRCGAAMSRPVLCMLVMMLAFAGACFAPAAVYAVWDNSTSIECSINTKRINLGVIPGIQMGTFRARSNVAGDCVSTKIGSTFAMMGEEDNQAAFCMTIKSNGIGGQHYLVNTRDPRYKIPIRFFPSNGGAPISDGVQGMPLVQLGSERSGGMMKDGSQKIVLDWGIRAELSLNGSVATGTYRQVFIVDLAEGVGDKSSYTAVNGPAGCASFPKREVQEVEVQVEVEPACRMEFSGGSKTGSINFGSHTNLDQALTQMLQMKVACTTGSGFEITMDKGAFGASKTQRRMKHNWSDHLVEYNLYRDASHTRVWDSVSFANSCSMEGGVAVPGGCVVTYPIYAQIPVQNKPPVGVYTDTVRLDFTFDPCECLPGDGAPNIEWP